MPRKVKVRKICFIPKSKMFKPDNDCDMVVTLSLVELEALRLVDYEMMDQDSAASKMQISRATLQRIIYAARKNIVDALINSKSIEIKGGSYTMASDHCDAETSCENCRFEKNE